MSTDANETAPAAADAHAAEAPKYFQEPASGIPLAVFAFGFSVTILSMANAGWIDARAGLFVPVAFGTGTLGMLVGGLMEYRRGNLFGATFCLSYTCFLLTTPLILWFFADHVTTLVGALAFGQAFGAYLLLWAVFTAFLAYGAYYIALPGFLAFVLLTIVYVLAGLGFMTGPGGAGLTVAAGWIGILDGLCAFWLGMALLLNPMGPREIIPLMPYPYTRRS
jgi:succinate-acetate transporter protein